MKLAASHPCEAKKEKQHTKYFSKFKKKATLYDVLYEDKESAIEADSSLTVITAALLSGSNKHLLAALRIVQRKLDTPAGALRPKAVSAVRPWCSSWPGTHQRCCLHHRLILAFGCMIRDFCGTRGMRSCRPRCYSGRPSSWSSRSLFLLMH